MEFITLLDRILEDPRIYLGYIDLCRLKVFLAGYYVCAFDNGITIKGASAFQKYVAQYYNCSDAIDWTDIVLKNSPNGEEAFDVVKKLVKSFMHSVKL